MVDRAEEPKKQLEHKEGEADGQVLKGVGGHLLTERHHEKGGGGGGGHGKQQAKFENPTKEDLAAQNNKDWDAYKAEQTKREATELKEHPYQTRPDRDFNLDEFVSRRREQDAKQLAKLDDNDLKVVGDVAKALAGPNPADKALDVLKKAYGDKYDESKMEGIDTALKLELQRRGMDKTWSTGIAWGPEGANVQIQDKRVNLAQGGGTEYQSYEGKLGKSTY